MGMYKVFEAPGGYEIFWCPSAPVHFSDKVPYDGKVYSKKQAAYRRSKQLNDARNEQRTGNAKEEAIV